MSLQREKPRFVPVPAKLETSKLLNQPTTLTRFLNTKNWKRDCFSHSSRSPGLFGLLLRLFTTFYSWGRRFSINIGYRTRRLILLRQPWWSWPIPARTDTPSGWVATASSLWKPITSWARARVCRRTHPNFTLLFKPVLEHGIRSYLILEVLVYIEETALWFEVRTSKSFTSWRSTTPAHELSRLRWYRAQFCGQLDLKSVSVQSP